MNNLSRRDRSTEELARIRELVDRHPLPKVVTGFDVQLGDFDGDPAIWVTFRLAHDVTVPGPELSALEEARQTVRTDLLEAIDDRYPYFRFQVDNRPTIST